MFPMSFTPRKLIEVWCVQCCWPSMSLHTRYAIDPHSLHSMDMVHIFMVEKPQRVTNHLMTISIFSTMFLPGPFVHYHSRSHYNLLLANFSKLLASLVRHDDEPKLSVRFVETHHPRPKDLFLIIGAPAPSLRPTIPCWRLGFNSTQSSGVSFELHTQV